MEIDHEAFNQWYESLKLDPKDASPAVREAFCAGFWAGLAMPQSDD